MSPVLLALGIGLLGGVGSCARFAFHRAFARGVPREFPFATYVVNSTGAFAIGVLAAVTTSSDARWLLGAGLLGGFTTFSTWMFESERLATEDYPEGAIVYVAISALTGFGAVALGVTVGGWF